MKINNLELAKTISDFMFLGIENFEERAKELFVLKHSLDDRGHGFEKYMQYYFKKLHGYKVELNGRTNQQDNGIDLKGIKSENGEIHYMIAQCKHLKVKDISLDDVASFYGKIAVTHLENKDKSTIYYITTSKFTVKAKDFLESHGVKAIDFQKISELQKNYPLSAFKNDVLKDEGYKEVEKCFKKEQLILDLDDNIINSSIENKELLQFMKQIRRDISNSHQQLKLCDIATNDTLKLIVENRPHNLGALKNITKSLPVREKNKLDKYGQVFIDRLQYLK